MRGSDFSQLFRGALGANLAWEASHPCPCGGADGTSDEVCLRCEGRGLTHDPPSAPFRGALTGLTARALEALSQRFGPGMVGDATASVPFEALCWASIRSGDRLIALDAREVLAWTLTPGRSIHLPWGAVLREATVMGTGGAIQTVPLPVSDVEGRIRVVVPTVLRLEAPRRYEVVRDLAQVRAFGTHLPRKVLLRLLDLSAR